MKEDGFTEVFGINRRGKVPESKVVLTPGLTVSS